MNRPNRDEIKGGFSELAYLDRASTFDISHASALLCLTFWDVVFGPVSTR